MEIEPVDLLTTYLSQHEEEGSLSDPLILIPTFENLPYLKNTLEQLEKRDFRRLVILDGGSLAGDMVSYLDSLTDAGFCVIRLPGNPGPKWCWENKDFYSALPEVFCVTDPDLLFNPELPEGFIDTLYGLTEEFKVGKAGFALALSEEIDGSEFFWGRRFHTVHSWEAKYWARPLKTLAKVEAYLAEIDTTFALYNKRFFNPASPLRAVRVGGEYAAQHIPWFPALRETFVAGATRGTHSSWVRGNELLLMRRALEAMESELSAIKGSLSWRVTAPLRFLLDRLWFFTCRIRTLTSRRPKNQAVLAVAENAAKSGR